MYKDLFSYQKEIVESKDDLIICNWSRGLGKDYALCHKILNDKPEQVVIVENKTQFQYFTQLLKEILMEDARDYETVKVIKCTKDEFSLSFNTGAKDINICRYDMGEDKRGKCKRIADLLIFNNHLPHDISNVIATQTISMVTMNNYNRKIQKLFPNVDINERGMNTMLNNKLISKEILEKYSGNALYEDFDILSNSKKEGTNRLEELMSYYKPNEDYLFLVQTLANLQSEYDKMFPSKDNVMTRGNLLRMIMEIHKNLVYGIENK